jgi:hypothetical protein
VLVGAVAVLSFVHALGRSGPLEWFPSGSVVVSSDVCPNPDPTGPPSMITSLHLHHYGFVTGWSAGAWFLLLLAAVVGYFSSSMARRLVQWSLVLASVGLAMSTPSWLEPTLLGQPYTDLIGCDPAPTDLITAADKGAYYMALWPQLVAAGALPILSLWDTSGRDRTLREAWRSRSAAWRWGAGIALGAIAALPFLPLLAGYGDMAEGPSYAVKYLLGAPVVMLTVMGVCALVPEVPLHRVGIAAGQAGAAVALSNLTALEVLSRSHLKKVDRDGTGLTLSSDLPERAAHDLDVAIDYFLLWFIGLSWLLLMAVVLGRLLWRPAAAPTATGAAAPIRDSGERLGAAAGESA